MEKQITIQEVIDLLLKVEDKSAPFQLIDEGTDDFFNMNYHVTPSQFTLMDYVEDEGGPVVGKMMTVMFSNKRADDLLSEGNEASSRNFLNAARPMLKYINDNGNPHTIAVIECNSARLLSGIKGVSNDEYVKD